MLPRLLVCDLDGTLVDSVPDLATALNKVLAARGLPPYAPAEVAAMVGDGVAALLRRGFAGRGVVADADVQTDYLAHYAAHLADATRPYPGIPEMLDTMRQTGWCFALCTNKPEAPARQLLAALGLAEFFPVIGGGDSFPTRKPDPAHLRATIARAAPDGARAIMLGDHSNDLAAAAGAGVPAIFARWGYGTPAMAQQAAATASTPAEVPTRATALLA